MTGQPKRAGARLSPGGRQFRGDDGSADPAVSAALAAFWTGEGTGRAALIALSASRLLYPVVALRGDKEPAAAQTAQTAQTAEKDSEMALPMLIGRDGRAAILAFTSLETLTRWQPDARPVPAGAIKVWQTAVAGDCAVVIDVAGPVPFAVEGARLAAVAAGQPPPLPHQDPDIAAIVAGAIAGVANITGARLEPGDPDRGAELAVRLRVNGGGAVAVRQAAERIAATLADRVRAVEITTELGPAD